MNIYFPQWQGAGTGKGIEAGAKLVREYFKNLTFVDIPLSSIAAGDGNRKKHDIHNYDAIFEQLARFKNYLEKERPKNVHTIGGDCGLEIVPVSYLNSVYQNLGVIWFDAHADINRPCDSGSCNFHGMPLRTLLGEGEPIMNSLLFSTIKGAQIHYVGLRDIDEAEQIRLDKDGIYHPAILDIEDLVQTLKSKNISQLYIHFDVDGLEPTDYNETFYQVPNGIMISDALACIKQLNHSFTVVGTSILESTSTTFERMAPITPILDNLFKT